MDYYKVWSRRPALSRNCVVPVTHPPVDTADTNKTTRKNVCVGLCVCVQSGLINGSVSGRRMSLCLDLPPGMGIPLQTALSTNQREEEETNGLVQDTKSECEAFLASAR